MAQHVGFYEVLMNGIKTLGQPGDPDHTLTFVPPANTATDNPGLFSFGVRFFNVDAVNGVRLKITLNNELIVHMFEKAPLRDFIQVVVPKNVIKPGVTNKVQCNVVEGTGSIDLQNPVVSYQRNI
jgi:hypothetical protein